MLADIKKRLPKDINNYTYYEPFIGAGALFFELLPQRAVINDINEQLIITYNVIKENVDQLIALLKKHQEMNDKEYYYEIRNMDRDLEKFNLLTNTEKAARLIFLNKTCYNGLYRVNSLGQYNVPYGKYKNPAIHEELVLRRIAITLIPTKLLSKILILNRRFQRRIKIHSFILTLPITAPSKPVLRGIRQTDLMKPNRNGFAML